MHMIYTHNTQITEAKTRLQGLNELEDQLSRMKNSKDAAFASTFVRVPMFSALYTPLQRVAKTHRMPYLHRSFFAKETCN